MRIKVECAPPLLPAKAWFIVPAVSTIQELKRSLCADIPTLNEQDLAADDITLELDGFDILDSSPVDIVRDGDLITIKQRVTHDKAASRKRKAVFPDISSTHKRAKGLANTTSVKTARSQLKAPVRKPQPASSSSSSGPSSDSSSDSTDSSSEDSDSDESSDSDEDTSDDTSSSSSSSAPPIESSKTKPNLPLRTLPPGSQHEQKPKQPENHVPPGQGKTATQNRNLRRRRKKQYERLAVEEALNGILGVNNIPLGLGTSAMAADAFDITLGDDAVLPPPSHTNTPPTFMMASLSNKNKRKGFKQAMASTLPKKIVFSAPDDTTSTVPESILPFPAPTSAEVAAAAPDNFLRLIPPSEKQENGQIPANMIVTSIDVEEGIHPTRKKDKKKQAPPQLFRSETQAVENVVLNYGDEDADMIPTQRTLVAAKILDKSAETWDFSPRDWQRVEEKWGTLKKISDAAQVTKRSLVGWKALGLNPATFTPEIMLNIGRVHNNVDVLVVEHFIHPDASQLLDEEDEDRSPEVQSYEWNEVNSGDWRLIT